ncbi:MAG: hypothetical protein SGILL_000506 [Bacillariaceae sp.]
MKYGVSLIVQRQLQYRMTRRSILPLLLVLVARGVDSFALPAKPLVGPSTFTTSKISPSSPQHGSKSSLGTVTPVATSIEHVSQNLGVLAPLFQQTEFWSLCVMLSIVSLLLLWEESVVLARTRLPPTLMPVVDSMLAEMGGLGFIGLFLGVVVTGGPLGRVVGHLSETFLGSEEFLLESFEFMHTAFFEVGISFFMVAGLTVWRVLQKLESLTEVSRVILDKNSDGTVCLDELASALGVGSVQVDLDADGEVADCKLEEAARTATKVQIWDELTMDTKTIKAEALVVRERLIQTHQVPPSFRIEDYFVKVFAENLQEIVELSPLSWVPLIPFLSIGRSVDISKDIVSAASPNAYEACGYFLDNPLFMLQTILAVTVSLIWCGVNFWKITQIKEMLLPILVREASPATMSNGQSGAMLVPPRYMDPTLHRAFNSSPSFVGWLERIFVGSSEVEYSTLSTHQQLFGAAGSEGPELYRNSIKYHTWLVVSVIVFWGSQIVARDASWLLSGLPPPSPDVNVPLELSIFTVFVSLSMAQLWLAPQTFLNYCLVTSIESLAKSEILDEIGLEKES